MRPRRSRLFAAPAAVGAMLLGACAGTPAPPTVQTTTQTVAPPQDTRPQVSAVRQPPAGSATSTTTDVKTLIP